MAEQGQMQTKRSWSMFGTSSEAPPHLWQDREIRFDVPVSSLEPRAGEFSIDNMVRVMQDWTALAA